MSFLSRSSNVVFPCIAGLALVLASACSSSDDDAAKADNGVNDVKAACEQRKTFTKPSAEKCVSCQSVASLADCGCESFAGFGGACVAQGDARRAEASCTDTIAQCVRDCADDCACADACYAGADACKRAAAAENGCIAKVCEQYCN